MVEKNYTACRALIVQDGKVLLIHRRQDGEEFWVFPGGHIENETPYQAVIREILEETGLEIIEIGPSIEYEHPKWGTHDAFMECKVTPGLPTLGGPEVSRKSEVVSYSPAWIPLATALLFDKLNPDPMREFFVNKYGNK